MTKAWVMSGMMSPGDLPIIAKRRRDAEEYAEGLLASIWNTPKWDQCGATKGVKKVREADRTVYIWGDGYVIKIERAVTL